MSADNRELFAKQVTDQMAAHMETLAARAKQDRLMLTLDAIAAEAIRLKIEHWDQVTFAELRELLRLARAAEREALSKAMEMKP